MSSIIPSYRGESCCICFKDYEDKNDPRVTHVGGEGHDGFHRSCLKQWILKRQSICPIDRGHIDSNSLSTRYERLISRLERLKPALIEGGVAAAITPLHLGLIGTTVAAMGQIASHTETWANDPLLPGGIAVNGLAAGVVSKMFLDGLNLNYGLKHLAQLGGIAAASLSTGIGKVNSGLCIFTAGLGIGAWGIKQAKQLLNRYGFDSNLVNIIGNGILSGTSLGLAISANLTDNEYVILGTMPLFAGLVTTILSCGLRR